MSCMWEHHPHSDNAPSGCGEDLISRVRRAPFSPTTNTLPSAFHPDQLGQAAANTDYTPTQWPESPRIPTLPLHSIRLSSGRRRAQPARRRHRQPPRRASAAAASARDPPAEEHTVPALETELGNLDPVGGGGKG